MRGTDRIGRAFSADLITALSIKQNPSTGKLRCSGRSSYICECLLDLLLKMSGAPVTLYAQFLRIFTATGTCLRDCPLDLYYDHDPSVFHSIHIGKRANISTKAPRRRLIDMISVGYDESLFAIRSLRLADMNRGCYKCRSRAVHECSSKIWHRTMPGRT